MGQLDGQVALVTGCGRLRGLGRGIALALAAEGAKVAVSDLKPTGTLNLGEHSPEQQEAAANWRGVDSLVEEIQAAGGKAMAVLGNVGRKADADRMVSEVIDEFGAVDILVNNAGAPQGLDRANVWEVPEEAFDIQWEVNTKGVFLMSAAVLRHLVERNGPGRIITISSSSGKIGAAKRTAYVASKFAAVGLTQCMALEAAPFGITVNAICPGPLDTPRTAARIAAPGPGEESDPLNQEPAHTSAPPTPVGRVGVPADIARTVLFLASPDAGYITGQAISVNGGTVLF